MSIPLIQQYLLEEGLDGWLLYDAEKINPLMYSVLTIPKDAHITRRIYYWIPARGEPIKIVHKIERQVLDHLPGKLFLYGRREELTNLLGFVKGKVAMEYSSQIYQISKVDGGTIDFFRKQGVEIVSSGRILQKCTSLLTDNQIESHLRAARILEQTVSEAYGLIAKTLKGGKPLFEGDVIAFIEKRFRDHGCVTNHSPIVARGANSANPHYSPQGRGDEIHRSDLVLIDLWCKEEKIDAIYADITRVAVGQAPTAEMKRVFHVVREAQRRGVAAIRSAKTIKGCNIDTVCRTYLESEGYGEAVYHRTGHNIHIDVHGPGANLDSFETFDERELLPRSCYSVEPALYFPGEFGIRLEHDILITERDILVTGGVQDELLAIC
jgi:Xaa-Pro dipeptidase